MLDLFMAWACTVIAEAFQGFVNFFTPLFGFDITLFNDTFSFAATAYSLIRDTALAIALLLAVWQVVVFFWKGADHAPATPARAALNTVVAVAFIFYGNYVFELILQFCQYPYDALSQINAVDWGVLHWGDIIPAILSDIFIETSMLLYLIMLIMICYNFVLLLLEIIERYCWTFVLLYLSPLASSTLASSTTNNIFKKYFTMFISQCLLLLLNVWCLKMACSGLSIISNGDSNGVVSLLLCYAFLRLSSKIDGYLNQLGLNSAITGAGLGAEIFAAGAAIVGTGKGKSGGSIGGSGSGSGSGNPILGATKLVGQYARRYTPIPGMAKDVVDTVAGGIKGGSEAYRSGKRLGDGLFTEGVMPGMRLGHKQSDSATSRWDSAIQSKNLDFTNKVIDGKNAVNTYIMESIAGGAEVLNPELHQQNARAGVDVMQAARDNTPIIPHEEGLGYKDQLNHELVDAKDDNGTFQQNITAWSENQRLAHSGFTYVQNTESKVENSQKVAAIAKGIGVDKVSKEAAEMVQAGFEQLDGVSVNDLKFNLSASGMHAEYDSRDGYRHKMDVLNHNQYAKLNTPEQEGFEKMATTDGHRYYVRTSKTKLEPLPKTDAAPKNTAAKPKETADTEPGSNTQSEPAAGDNETATNV